MSEANPGCLAPLTVDMAAEQSFFPANARSTKYETEKIAGPWPDHLRSSWMEFNRMQLRAAEREMAEQQHSRTLAQSSSLFE